MFAVANRLQTSYREPKLIVILSRYATYLHDGQRYHGSRLPGIGEDTPGRAFITPQSIGAEGGANGDHHIILGSQPWPLT